MVVTFGAFVFTPELRRIIDWRIGYDRIDVISILPLLMLCPIAVLAYLRGYRLSSRVFSAVALTWTVAFAYGVVVATAHGAIVQGLYGFARFCLPVTLGIWLLTSGDSLQSAHAKIARSLLIFGSIAAAYGIIQYVTAPPWDTAWMQEVGNETFGTPERFGIRVFAVLNEPQIFALFLTAVMLFNLPYLRVRNVFQMLAILVMIIGLVLTLARASWVFFVIGMIVFVLLSPKRLQAIYSISSVAAVCAVVASFAIFASPNANTSEVVSQRFSSLTDAQEDYSVQDRQRTADAAFQTALSQPAGGGLGLTGESAKLGSRDAQIFSGAPSETIDNGFISRFLEMGVIGFAVFIVACFWAFISLFRAYLRFARLKDRSAMVVTASCIAVGFVMFVLNSDGDYQQALLGMLFFTALALPLMRSEHSPASVAERSPTLKAWRGTRSWSSQSSSTI